MALRGVRRSGMTSRSVVPGARATRSAVPRRSTPADPGPRGRQRTVGRSGSAGDRNIGQGPGACGTSSTSVGWTFSPPVTTTCRRPGPLIVRRPARPYIRCRRSRPSPDGSGVPSATYSSMEVRLRTCNPALRPAAPVALPVEHRDSNAGHRASGSMRILTKVSRGGDRRINRLCGSVEVVKHVTEIVHELRGEVAGDRGAGRGDKRSDEESLLVLGRLRSSTRRLRTTGTVITALHLVGLHQRQDAFGIRMPRTSTWVLSATVAIR